MKYPFERRQAARQYWDNAAPFFDDEPDHGLRDPVILETWTRFLQTSLPYTAAAILDIGCGTGALSVDALVCRHLLWALPEPRRVLHRWAEFLKPNGRLILIEGFWNTIDSAKPSGFAADAGLGRETAVTL